MTIPDQILKKIEKKEEIEKAIFLAINARKNLDPYYNPNEIDQINIKELYQDIHSILLSKKYKYIVS